MGKRQQYAHDFSIVVFPSQVGQLLIRGSMNIRTPLS